MINNCELKFFKVDTKCGHVGRRNYILITFPVMAKSGKEAARIARGIPRVKHHHKDAILNVNEISYKEYCVISERNNKDPYLFCHSKKEQRELADLKDRLIKETNYINNNYNKKDRKDIALYKLKKWDIILKSACCY